MSTPLDPNSTTINKTTYTFDLTSTENILNRNDMTPYVSAVSNFIEANCLPSFCYPEVYEFMVTQRNVRQQENQFGHLVFEIDSSVSIAEQHALCKVIMQMVEARTVHFHKIADEAGSAL